MAAENVQVAVRLRPAAASEDDESDSLPIWSVAKASVVLHPDALLALISDKRLSSSSHPSFSFDHAFLPDDDNYHIYTTMVRPIVLSALEGFNATVFAYGQTGSGKTYTMLGVREEENEDPCRTTPKRQRGKEEVLCLSETRKRATSALGVLNRSLTPSKNDTSCRLYSTPNKCETWRPKTSSQSANKGIIVYSLEDIFKSVPATDSKHYFFSCSYIEIYNEHVYDLLKETQEMKAETLTIIESTDKEFYVRGLSEHSVASIADVLGKLEMGEVNRHYAATNLNHNSSRSHTIFRLNVKSLQVVQGEEDADNLENVTTESILNFVDLAGSERVGNLQTVEGDKGRAGINSSFHGSSSKSDLDKILAESKNINTSLFYLCQVISKLAEQKMGLLRNDSHIPFRNSNLTKILRSSLGGNARTCILCTVTPTSSQFEQTLSTLRFGSNARSITNKVKANVKRESSAQILIAYEQDASVLRRELELLAQRTRAATSENVLLKQRLEGRLKRLTQMLYEKTRREQGGEERVFGEWTYGAGDLITSSELIPVTRPPVALKCDEDGQFALQILKQISTLHKGNQGAITRTIASVQSIKSLKSQVFLI
jgi:hypothetical protein